VGRSGGQAFLWQNGTMSPLGSLVPGGGSWASGINAAGQVVGTSDTAVGQHAFLWDPNVTPHMIDLAPLTFNGRSDASRINSAGQVVGVAEVDSAEHAFVYEGGTAYDLNDIYPSPHDGWAHFYEANGINDNHQVVGMGTLISGEEHAFLLTDDN